MRALAFIFDIEPAQLDIGPIGLICRILLDFRPGLDTGLAGGSGGGRVAGAQAARRPVLARALLLEPVALGAAWWRRGRPARARAPELAHGHQQVVRLTRRRLE